jgi:wyosine [tRNA(Phe)-imidazoG37] synthetase (radical SAM superfamily)
MVAGYGSGDVFEVPELAMVGAGGTEARVPGSAELIPLPLGSELFELPGRVPLGYDEQRRQVVPLRRYQGKAVVAVAAFMAPAHAQVLRAAYVVEGRDAPRLPLYAYTAAGWRAGGFWVAGHRVDRDARQDPDRFDEERIEQGRLRLLHQFPGNRLVHHLMENCVRRYGCPAARNLALGRWECPVPTSSACNARCVGCISSQPGEEVCASQDRLDFVPTVEEIVAFTVPHLEQAPRAVISFGQGCEGEPLLQGPLLEGAIRAIRQRTERGTINLNTNGSLPQVVERLCAAGLDSIRVSLNSAQPALYARYFRPRGYTLEDVLESLRVVHRFGGLASINYFIFPGLTDSEPELEGLLRLIERTGIDLIQMRNLNMDPGWYLETLGADAVPAHGFGILSWMQRVRQHYPRIRFGYFNPAREAWEAGPA